MHELYRIQSIWERKYKFENSRVGQAVFSIDKLPGIFDQPAVLQTANVAKALVQKELPDIRQSNQKYKNE